MAYSKKHIKFVYLIISLLIVVADQTLKGFVAHNFSIGEVRPVLTNVISLTYLQNNGAAWNILTGQMWLFYIISVIAILICLYYIFQRRNQSKLMKLGLAIVLGGIIGNLIDRIHLKYVIDMIQLDFINFNIFNIADSAITVGIVLVFIYLLFLDESEKEHGKKL